MQHLHVFGKGKEFPYLFRLKICSKYFECFVLAQFTQPPHDVHTIIILTLQVKELRIRKLEVRSSSPEHGSPEIPKASVIPNL